MIKGQTIYGNYEKGETIRCGRIKSNGNVLRDWEDGTFTVYPQQSGTPCYFEEVKTKPLQNVTL